MVTAIIQARMGSTRLPGKVLMPLGNRSVLGWAVRAASSATRVSRVIVATTTLAEDDVTVDAASKMGAETYRGPVDDVLSRYIGAIDQPSSAIVRLTADCPFLDPDLIDLVVAIFEAGSFDYVSTLMPRCLPRGLDVEVVSTEAILEAGALARGYERVHVTPYVHENPLRFHIGSLVLHPDSSRYRVTIDTKEDLVAARMIAERITDAPPRWRDLVQLLDDHPDIAAVNAGVRQKKPEEG